MERFYVHLKKGINQISPTVTDLTDDRGQVRKIKLVASVSPKKADQKVLKVLLKH